MREWAVILGYMDRTSSTASNSMKLLKRQQLYSAAWTSKRYAMDIISIRHQHHVHMASTESAHSIDSKDVEMTLGYDSSATSCSLLFVGGRVPAVRQVHKDGKEAMVLCALRRLNDMTFVAICCTVTGQSVRLPREPRSALLLCSEVQFNNMTVFFVARCSSTSRLCVPW